jgi:hypothetical protein
VTLFGELLYGKRSGMGLLREEKAQWQARVLEGKQTHGRSEWLDSGNRRSHDGLVDGERP